MSRSRPVRTPQCALVVVDPAGRGDCTTLAEALLLVPAAGGHIYLAKGTHALATKLSISSRTNLTIEGSMGSIVDIDAIGNNDGIDLSTCTNITFRGFQMVRTTANNAKGFFSFSGTASNIMFENLYLNATNTCMGFNFEDTSATSDVGIVNCSIKCGGGTGLYLWAGGAHTRYRIVGNHWIGSGSVGIKFTGAWTTITDVVIEGNTFTGYATTIDLTAGTQNISIVGNTIRGGSQAVYIEANTCIYTSITGNAITGVTGGSPVIDAGIYTTISGNVISGSAGAITENGTFATITGNSFNNLSATAIYVQGASNLISGNWFYNLAVGRAIEINGVADTIIENNDISSIFGYGIYPHGAARTIIIGNKVNVAGWHGIYLDNCAGSIVSGNYVYASQAGGVGIYVTASSNSNISGNIALSNTGGGILVDASALVTVSGNTCLSNTGPGISLTNADNCAVTGNLCSANSTYGISEDAASTGNNFSGNRLTTNTTARLLISAGKVLYQDGVGSIKATGTTANAYATVFDFAASNSGLAGCFRVFNTDAANTLTYQITFTGMDGSSQVQSADIAPLSNAVFDAHTDQGTALVPFNGIKCEVKSKVAGSHATYSVYAALAGAEV